MRTCSAKMNLINGKAHQGTWTRQREVTQKNGWDPMENLVSQTSSLDR